MPESSLVPAPQPLESPPRTTGNAATDLPILIDWFWKAYLVITDSVSYINGQVNTTDFTVASLPDPSDTTLAQAQQTANEAYNLASANKNILDGLVSGTFDISGSDIGFELVFTDEQADTNYRIIVQAVSTTGSPSNSAYIPKTKTYAVDKFTVIMLAAPGSGNTITFEWQLIRND